MSKKQTVAKKTAEKAKIDASKAKEKARKEAAKAKILAKKTREDAKVAKAKAIIKAQKERQKKINKLLIDYVKVVKKTRKFPTRSDLAAAGISRDTIRHYFVNIKGMRTQARDEYPDAFGGVVDVEKATKAYVDKKLEKSKVIFITTAVNGQFADSKFIKTLENFKKRRNATVLILPANDPAHNLDNGTEWHLADEIVAGEFPIVFDEYKLNSNLHISGIRVNAKQINPTTGLGRIADKGSFIFASPKQSLEYVANSNFKLPHAMMSTGACTVSNYSSTRGNSQRTAFLAENDHRIGGIIVEIQDDEIYHFRQVQADKNGSFIDLGTEYSSDGKIRSVVGDLVMGDYHAGEHDESAVLGNENLVKRIKAKRVFAHDMFNGNSISHHDEQNIIVRAQRAKKNELSLEQELKVTSEQMDRIAGWKSVKELIMVKSNHDEFLIRWLQRGVFNKDPHNFSLGCKLADAAVEYKDPLQEGIEIVRPLKHADKVTWLQRDEDYKIAGIECGSHGDKGPNGSRGAKNGIEKAYGSAVIGHSHTPGILRGVFQVGTTSLLKLGYNVGPSSWVHCSCIVYPNGQRQLINFINGQYTILKAA